MCSIKHFKGTREMNNEPVAWWCAKEYADSDMEGGHVEELEFNQPSIHDPEGLIWEKPLYTHPTKTQSDIEYEADKAYWRTRTLTDEEIDDIWAGISTGDDVIDMHLFARAILRKAQEK